MSGEACAAPAFLDGAAAGGAVLDKSGAIDGFTMSMPWPVMASRDGTAVVLMSIPRGDLAELYPFSF